MARSSKHEQRAETLRRKDVRRRKAQATRFDVTTVDLTSDLFVRKAV